MEDKEDRATDGDMNFKTISSPTDSHMVYELRRKQEKLIRELVTIQVAIDAINQVRY